MPWTDHAGRFSVLRVAVLVLLCLPAAVVAIRYGEGALGPRPLNAALHEIGNWTLKLLLLTLSIRPLRTILDWPRLMTLRRTVGVATFLYAVLHLCLYAAGEAFDLVKVASEIVLRIYLTIGFAALLILLALAATSTDGMVRQLGARRWQGLHRLVHAAALLGVVHFFMQVKADLDEPWIAAGLFAWLTLWRLAAWREQGRGRRRRGIAASPAFLAALAVAAAALTALGEAAYFAAKLGVPPATILMANLSLDAGLRPAVVVLAVGLCLALAGGARLAADRRRPAKK